MGLLDAFLLSQTASTLKHLLPSRLFQALLKMAVYYRFQFTTEPYRLQGLLGCSFIIKI